MDDYLQPAFYRFNQDSIALVDWVQKKIRRSPRRVLDLGAGCGVIGLELAQRTRPTHLTLVELQDEFRPYLEKNSAHYCPPETQSEVVISSFSQWKPSSYDLIVSNPPYYLSDSGKMSPDPRRAIARSFIQDGWSQLLALIERSLDPSGQCFLVIKHEGRILSSFERAAAETKLLWKSENHRDLIFLELHRP